MKYLLGFGLIVIVSIGLIKSFSNPVPPSPLIGITIKPESTKALQMKSRIISYGNNEYRLVYEPLAGREILLIPNFNEKQLSSSIIETHKCTIASSAGFYTTENTPLGLFKIDGVELGTNKNNSSLLTGYLYISNNGTIMIESTYRDDFSTALQSGPLFTKAQTFTSKQDEHARRIVIIADTAGEYYLASLYQDSNNFSGPLLSEIPRILYSADSPLSVNKILNLDGGSASFFYNGSDKSVSELVPVGGVICVR